MNWVKTDLFWQQIYRHQWWNGLVVSKQRRNGVSDGWNTRSETKTTYECDYHSDGLYNGKPWNGLYANTMIVNMAWHRTESHRFISLSLIAIVVVVVDLIAIIHHQILLFDKRHNSCSRLFAAQNAHERKRLSSAFSMYPSLCVCVHWVVMILTIFVCEL